MTLRELMKTADVGEPMWFRVIDGDTGACCYVSSRFVAQSHTAERLADREVAELAIETGVHPDLKRGAKAVLAVRTAKKPKVAAEGPKDGRTPPSLRTDDVRYGDKLRKFRVRMAREQSFTANVEAHNAAEAEIVAENFCEAMGSARWDAFSEHVHKTFEAEPQGGGRRRP